MILMPLMFIGGAGFLVWQWGLFGYRDGKSFNGEDMGADKSLGYAVFVIMLCGGLAMLLTMP